jgi:hypothetical protein
VGVEYALVAIVPSEEDRDVYLVLEDFGPLGRAWCELEPSPTVPNELASSLPASSTEH